jgi:signal recognition particle receptor subunit alpha
MLEAFIIFARGGIILFSWTAVALKGSPVDALVSNVLLEERSGKSDYTYTAGATKYTLKWSFHNELGLVFVAVRAPLPLVASLYTTPCAQQA